MEPTVSVVIPTRDTRELTLSAVESLHRQSRIPFETIVVDDGSVDGTLEAVSRSFPDVKQVRIPGSVGFTGAVNEGVSASCGELIWLLNSDTIASPDAVELLVSNFKRDQNLGICGAALSYPDGTPQWSGGKFPDSLWLLGQASGLPELLGHFSVWRRLKPVSGTVGLDVDWVTGAAMALRREVWDGVGPFHDEYQFYCQDLDLCWRAKTKGWKVSVLPEVQVTHHLGGTIRSMRDAVGPVLTTDLWRDLVRVFFIHQGDRAGFRAARLIQIGGWLRVVIRKCVSPFVANSKQRSWEADTEAYIRALREVARVASAPSGSLSH